MNHWWYLQQEAKIRNQEMAQEIRRNRLNKFVKQRNLDLYNNIRKVLYRFGGLLIHSGKSLQLKYGDYCQLCEPKPNLVQKG